MEQFIVFVIENKRFVYNIHKLDRVIWAVEVTPLPKASPELLGIINLHGDVIPVINMRKILQLPERDLKITDQFMITTISNRTTALWVDSVEEVLECSKENLISGEKLFPDLKNIDYVIRKNNDLFLGFKWDDIIHIHDLYPVQEVL